MKVEGLVDYDFVDPTGLRQHQVRGTGKLSVPLLPALFITSAATCSRSSANARAGARPPTWWPDFACTTTSPIKDCSEVRPLHIRLIPSLRRRPDGINATQRERAMKHDVTATTQTLGTGCRGTVFLAARLTNRLGG